MGVTLFAQALHRFWTMLAHAHGGIWGADGPGHLSTPLLRDHAREAASTRLVDVFEEECRRSGRGIRFQPEAASRPVQSPSVTADAGRAFRESSKGGPDLLPLNWDSSIDT